mmetsp:Transcript_15284/g.43717  ORF Transcript_15284/g.43717 Transcript_15284/m.43717 type:complete len:773 (-) Transcript_15284:77-2395(-)|eukprot:CAMPEP_0179216194 /NCGR_PEP_ID=MMETSP0797-20121207/3249_1 /TAXON_ID=47934 /ORGANISM="Dinophysis acuminata, Strain DAEP01" /LENGTH=772 /DNA_ID=CAMNT_0020922337 /DNA_START=26 /DNA_END=2344 /DNA_ORIENTATION=-
MDAGSINAVNWDAITGELKGFAVPSAVLFMGLVLRPLWAVLPFVPQETASYVGLLATVGIVAARRTGSKELEPEAKQLRSVYGEPLNLTIRTLAHISCIRYAQATGSDFFWLFSTVLLPLSCARDAECNVRFQFYLVVHFLVTFLHASGNENSWQWLAILLIVDLFLRDMTMLKGKQESPGLTQPIYGVVRSLLVTMCDGYLILGEDGSVAGADEKALDLLEVGPDMKGEGRGQAALAKAAAPLLGDGNSFMPGLSKQRLTLESGRSVELVMYTVAEPVPAKFFQTDITAITGVPPSAKGRLRICAMRIIRELGEGVRDRVPSANESLSRTSQRRLTPPLPASLSESNLTEEGIHLAEGNGNKDHNFYPYVMRPEPSLCGASGILTPRTEMPGNQGRFPGTVLRRENEPNETAPATHWFGIQTVGLGVGNYTKVRMVGRGGQGSVWEVTSQDGTRYAQKEISLKGVLWHRDFPKRMRDADREVRALKGLAWASCVVVPIVDCWIQNNFETAYIVMEWLPRTLAGILDKRRKEHAGPVPLAENIRWLAHLASGLVAIHSAFFIHRDMKPANILLDESGQVCKIADLGVSRALVRKNARGGSQVSAFRPDNSHDEDQASFVSSTDGADGTSRVADSQISLAVGSILSGYTVRPGTNTYSSPEALKSGHYGTETDVFSLGAVLFETLTLDKTVPMHIGDTESALPAKAKELLMSGRVANDKRWSKLVDLCIRMLSKQPEDRPTAGQVAASHCLRPHLLELMERCARLQTVMQGHL